MKFRMKFLPNTLGHMQLSSTVRSYRIEANRVARGAPAWMEITPHVAMGILAKGKRPYVKSLVGGDIVEQEIARIGVLDMRIGHHPILVRCEGAMPVAR